MPISKLAGITTLGKLRLCGPKERIDRNSGCVPPGKVKRSAYASPADLRAVRRRSQREMYLILIQRSWQFWKTGDGLELSRMGRILAFLLVLSGRSWNKGLTSFSFFRLQLAWTYEDYIH